MRKHDFVQPPKLVTTVTKVTCAFADAGVSKEELYIQQSYK